MKTYTAKAGEVEQGWFVVDAQDKVLGKLVQKAVLNVFNRSFSSGELDPVVTAFQGGFGIDVADSMPSKEYVRQIAEGRQARVGRALGACAWIEIAIAAADGTQTAAVFPTEWLHR